MGLWNKLMNELIDIIDWVDNTNNTIVWKFPRYENEIKMGAKLIVRESQQAVFFNQGQMADVYTPGTYTLATENMPILTTLNGWKYGFHSPFKADVFFVSTKQFIGLKWGTQNPITLNGDRFGMVEMRAFGSFGFQITDAGKFVKEIAGTNSEYSTEKILTQLRGTVVAKFTDILGESDLTIDKIARNQDEIGKIAIDKLNQEFVSYGLRLTTFYVENVSMPEELKKEIFEYSRLNAIDMQKLAQFKTAKSIEKAAENQNGMPGMGVGMGVGMGLNQAMTNAFGHMNAAQNQMQQTTTTIQHTTPPPLTQFYSAVNGQQSGPYTVDQLAGLVSNGTIKRETLVWKTGMAEWAKAETVAEFSNIFLSTPPPPPPVG